MYIFFLSSYNIKNDFKNQFTRQELNFVVKNRGIKKPQNMSTKEL